MSNWSYGDLLKLVEIKDKNIDHYLERITELETELERTREALDVIKKEMSKETMPDFAVIHNALKGVSDE